MARVRARIRNICALAILLFLLALPEAVQAQFTFTTNNGTITITGYTGSGGLVVIPSATNGWPVKSIGANAFAQNTVVSNVVIPDSITNIGTYAFYESGLTNVSIPGGVVNVAYWAFGWCTNLASVTLAASTINLGDNTFADCPRLESVTMLSSVSNLDIGNQAFASCTNLTNFLVGSGVSALDIGAGAFANCSSLASFTLDPANPFLAFSNGVLFDVSQTTLIWCSPATSGSYVVPNTVVSIQNNAFFSCTNLTGINLPGGLTTIGYAAFSGCSRLSSVDVPAGVENIETNTFSSCLSLTNAVLGGAVTNISDWAFYNCTNLVSVTPSSNLFVIGNNAFENCYPLTNFIIPNSVTSIGSAAFESCFNANFSIGNGLTNIGQYAFGSCAKLANVNIPSGVVSIGGYAFEYCQNLTNVTVPANTTSIGFQPFFWCTNLLNITVDTNNPTYASLDGVLFDHSLTTLICCPAGKRGSYTIPDTVTNLAVESFWACGSLMTVVVDAKVGNIFDDTFGISSAGVIFFKGNAPTIDGTTNDPLLDPMEAVYYLPGTTGWSTTFGGVPALLWNPQAQLTHGTFGVSTNGFGFNITGTTNISFVVDAAAGLGGPWVSLQSISLTNGSYYFSDPQWTNYPKRFYRFRSP